MNQHQVNCLLLLNKNLFRNFSNFFKDIYSRDSLFLPLVGREEKMNHALDTNGVEYIYCPSFKAIKVTTSEKVRALPINMRSQKRLLSRGPGRGHSKARITLTHFVSTWTCSRSDSLKGSSGKAPSAHASVANYSGNRTGSHGWPWNQTWRQWTASAGCSELQPLSSLSLSLSPFSTRSHLGMLTQSLSSHTALFLERSQLHEGYNCGCVVAMYQLPGSWKKNPTPSRHFRSFTPRHHPDGPCFCKTPSVPIIALLTLMLPPPQVY